MYIKAGRLQIHIGVPAAAFIALAANSIPGKIYIFALLSMLFHEAVHIICLFLCGCKAVSLKIYPGGIKLSADGINMLSYSQSFFCAISAPLMNLASGLLLLCICGFFSGGPLLGFSAVNIAVGAVNLIPLPFLDGGRALEAAALLKCKNPDAAVYIADCASVFSVIFIFVILLLCLLRRKYFFVILFFAVYCFCELAADTRQKR